MAGFLKEELWAFLLKPRFQDLLGEALMHPGATCHALKATPVWLPAVMGFNPWFGTSFDQVSFEVFGHFALVPGCFLVNVVLRVVIDRAQPLDGMCVDQLMICVKGGLPFCLSVILEVPGSFPGC